MKSNFDFLNRYWPALAQIGATAETYVYSDPNACIYKLGMFAERLVQEILVFEHIAEPAVANTHANRIRILKRAGLLPHEIDNTLYVLRKTRNSAVHIGTDSVDEAKTLLSLTYNLAVWFMETYGDWGYIAPEFVMPSETTHEDLESVIAEQETYRLREIHMIKPADEIHRVAADALVLVKPQVAPYRHLVRAVPPDIFLAGAF